MKIQIKGQSYEVKRKDLIDNDVTTVGQILKVDKKIFLSKNSPYVDNTIIHELVHGFLWECGLIEQSSDEDLVCWLSFNIPQIMKVYEKIKASKLYEELKDV